MGTATYKLVKHAGRGAMRYAVVTATADFADECSVAVSPDAFAWLREAYGPNAVIGGLGFGADRAAAELGAMFALRHVAGQEGLVAARVVIDSIRTAPVDTTPDDIAYASCWAVWQALGMQGSSPPVLPSKHAGPGSVLSSGDS